MGVEGGGLWNISLNLKFSFGEITGTSRNYRPSNLQRPGCAAGVSLIITLDLFQTKRDKLFQTKRALKNKHLVPDSKQQIDINSVFFSCRDKSRKKCLTCLAMNGTIIELKIVLQALITAPLTVRLSVLGSDVALH